MTESNALKDAKYNKPNFKKPDVGFRMSRHSAKLDEEPMEGAGGVPTFSGPTVGEKRASPCRQRTRLQEATAGQKRPPIELSTGAQSNRHHTMIKQPNCNLVCPRKPPGGGQEQKIRYPMHSPCASSPAETGLAGVSHYAAGVVREIAALPFFC